MSVDALRGAIIGALSQRGLGFNPLAALTMHACPTTNRAAIRRVLNMLIRERAVDEDVAPGLACYSLRRPPTNQEPNKP